MATTTVPNTGGWQSWQSVSATVDLSVGIHTLKILDTRRSWNLNWFSFSSNLGQKTQKVTGDLDVNQATSSTSTTGVFPNPVEQGKELEIVGLEDNVFTKIEVCNLQGKVLRRMKRRTSLLLKLICNFHQECILLR